MSSREVQNLKDNTPAKSDLRSGRSRGDPPVNSTNNDRSDHSPTPPESEISTIQQHGSEILQSSAYQESIAQYEESPWGGGSGTTLIDTEVRRIRTSEDELMIQDTVNAQLEQLRAEVDWFKADLANEEGWELKVTTQYERISTSVKSFIARLALVGDGVDLSAIDKATDLSLELDKARDKLYDQLKENYSADHRPALRPSNLSVRFENCEPNDSERSIGTIMPALDDVFDQEPELLSNTSIESRQIQELSQKHDVSASKIQSFELILQQLSTSQTEIRESMSILDDTVQVLSNNQEEAIEKMQQSIKRIEREKAASDTHVKDLNDSVNSLRNAFKGLQTNVRENKKRLSTITEPPRNQVRSNTQPTSKHFISEAALAILEKNIKELEEKICAITATNISDLTSESRISSLMDREAKALEKHSNLLYEKLTKYSDVPSMSKSLSEKTQKTLDDAAAWSRALNVKYTELKMYDIQSANRITIEVTKFEEKGEQSIYEFLKDFNACYRGRGTDQVKANQLWKKYISPAIQADTEALKDDFQALQKHLIDNYGDLDYVVDGILRGVEKLRKPHEDNTRDRHVYMKRLLGALQKLEAIPERMDINKKVWELTVLAHNSFTRILKLLTKKDNDEFSKILTTAGISTVRLSGKIPFAALLQFVQDVGINTARALELEASVSSAPDTQKKGAHVVQEDVVDSVQASASNHDFMKTASSVNAASPQPWYDLKYRKPCAMLGHKHEITDCPEFWALPPFKRRIVTDRKICWTCLDPREKCKVSDPTNSTFFCSNVDIVQKKLLCIQCSDYIKKNQKPFSPTNIFMCRSKLHANDFPTLKSIRSQVLDFLPGLDIEKVFCYTPTTQTPVSQTPVSKTPIQTHNIITNPTTVASTSTRDSVIVNSSTGLIGPAQGKKLVNESKDEPIFVMQNLKIGSEKVLTMFDTGAGIHLIEGGLAESQGLEKISAMPTSLSVVGGGSVPTEFGVFRFFLGPTPDGSHRELVCQGIQCVTDPIAFKDLAPANDELKQLDPSFNGTTLPPTAGGSRARLLIGIRDPEIHPVPILTLPSGLGLFKSKFKDMHGSYYCYGGPHSSFNVGPKNTTAMVMFAQMYNQYKNSLYDSTRFFEDFPPQPPKIYAEANDYMTSKNYIFSCHTCEKPVEEPLEEEQLTFVGITMSRYKDLLN